MDKLHASNSYNLQFTFEVNLVVYYNMLNEESQILHMMCFRSQQSFIFKQIYFCIRAGIRQSHAFWALCCDVVSRYFLLYVSTTNTYFVISNLCVGAFKYFVQYKTIDSRPNLFLMVENQRLDFLFQCTKTCFGMWRKTHLGILKSI